MDFVEELKWRGMVHDLMPGTQEYLQNNKASGYIGFDPTADSLGIGNLVQVMFLVHFQRAGHKPYALVGGATGMIGDPSGKSEERKLLSEDEIRYNVERQSNQLRSFLDFDSPSNKAEIVNNYDWFKEMNLLTFLRDVGKHLTVNYMMSKDSVKNRLESGISFTEFSYQLIQGYDFYHLWKEHNCMIQMGGSDQWGNITAGTELIRRMAGGEAYAITTPLLTKSDGQKFGKSEAGNIWLDPAKTSPYEFYQYWVNVADADIEKVMKIFSLRSHEEMNALFEKQKADPASRIAQYAFAEELTERVHGKDALQRAQEATQKLFALNSREDLNSLTEEQMKDVFRDVPHSTIPRSEIESGVGILELLVRAGAAKSNGDARRSILQDKSIRINMEKCEDAETQLTAKDLIHDKFILVNKGKKQKFIVYAG